MEVKRYCKRPLVIEAMQWASGMYADAVVISDWVQANDGEAHWDHDGFFIATLEGHMEILPSDWVIRGVKGEFYPCKPDIFEATYESVDEPFDDEGEV